jgi:hypothetical protein
MAYNEYSARRMDYKEWVNADGNQCKKVKLVMSKFTEGVVIRVIILQRMVETHNDVNVKNTLTYGVVQTMPDRRATYLVAESELFHSASDLVKYMLTVGDPDLIPCETTNVVCGRNPGFGNTIYVYGTYEKLTDPEKVEWAHQSVQTMFDNIASAAALAAADEAAAEAEAAAQDRLAAEQDRLAANQACLEAIYNVKR